MIAYPLTIRGTLIVLAGIYLFLFPAQNSADLVASLLGLTIVIFGILLPIVTIAFGLILKRRTSVQIIGPDEIIISNTLAKVGIRTSVLSVPPLYSLKIKMHFLNTGLEASTHELIGSSSKERRFIETIKFPHRGNWEVKELALNFGDNFGLSSVSWKIPLTNCTFRVYPGGEHQRQIPIVSSTQRSGDELEHPTQRTGDPLDLKPYHPSDGVRRILWKVFAKSGQLITRHPEKSMTPEGKIFSLILAGPKDDSSCQMALNHLTKIEELSLENWSSCLGTRVEGLKPQSGVDAVADLAIDTAWAAQKLINTNSIANSIKTEIQYLLSNIPSDNSELSSIYLFIGKSILSSEQHLRDLKEVGSWLNSRHIDPIFCVEEQELRSNTLNPTQTKMDFFKKIFFDSPKSELDIEALKYYPEFLKICAQTGWQVIV